MSRTAADRVLLARFAESGGAGAGLLRAAVLLARTECPDADPDRVEAILERIAGSLRRRGGGAQGSVERAFLLARVLAGERGLRGCGGRYDDPRNSCPECVLDLRLGLPLALSLLWMEAGRRVGWKVEGVGLPGHFVVRVRGTEGDSVLADPFHGGGILTPPEMKRILQEATGKPVSTAGLDLRGMPPGEILLRMLRNLRAVYRQRGDRLRALAVAEDMLLLAPGLPEALRDRGLLRMEGGDRKGGIADLRGFLDRAPDAPGADSVLRLVSIVTDGAELPN